MQFAISSRSFEWQLSDGKQRLWDIPGEARLLGVRHVELHDVFLKPAGLRLLGRMQRFFQPPSPAPPDRVYDPGLLNRIQKALEYYSVSVAAWACDSELGDPDLLPRARAYVRLALRTARTLGAPVLCITVDHDAVARNVKPVLSSLSALVVDAEMAGVRLALENDQPDARVERLLGIVQGVGSPWLGMSLNLQHFDPRSPAGLFERLAAQAIHVLAPCCEDGEIDGVYRAYFGVLRTLRYEGAVSVELPGSDDPALGLRRALDTLVRW